jgi:hypothetical protein
VTYFPVEQVAKQFEVTPAYVQWGRRVLRGAEPHIIQMVEGGEVNVHVAAASVLTADRLTQASWTKQEVEREGKKVIASYPSNAARSRDKPPAAATAVAKPPRKREVLDIDHIVGFPKTLARGESGITKDMSFEEVSQHQEKYGKAQITAKAVRDMQDDNFAVEQALAGLILLLSDVRPAPAECFAALDRMLVGIKHLKQPNFVDQGWDVDWPGKAQKHFRDLRRLLPKAIALLTEYQRHLDGHDTGSRTQLQLVSLPV